MDLLGGSSQPASGGGDLLLESKDNNLMGIFEQNQSTPSTSYGLDGMMDGSGAGGLLGMGNTMNIPSKKSIELASSSELDSERF